jgi:putative Mg2+ transporter-C (MgtC) family protein
MPAFSLELTISHLLHLVAAYALALPIAWDREQRSGGAGLRTFPLVAMGSCGYMLTGLAVLQGDPNANSRVIYGLITGMGFIGGGAILKGQHRVTGPATAAALWNTGVIGIAIAWDRFDIAIITSLINLLTFRYFSRFKREPEEQED